MLFFNPLQEVTARKKRKDFGVHWKEFELRDVRLSWRRELGHWRSVKHSRALPPSSILWLASFPPTIRKEQQPPVGNERADGNNKSRSSKTDFLFVERTIRSVTWIWENKFCFSSVWHWRAEELTTLSFSLSQLIKRCKIESCSRKIQCLI